jgi:membrane fusion protein, multidrug efflux system
MNQITKTILALVSVSLLLAACSSSGAKDAKGEASSIKTEIEKLKKQKSNLDADIKKLEDKLAKADPEAAKQTAKLINVDTLRIKDFAHYIELQGKVGADGVGYVAPKGQGGLVRAIYVSVGQKVGAGQIVAKLDDAMQRQGVVQSQQGVIAAQQQTGQLKARLVQAQTIYTKYQSLWKQGIGAEIQVINAKADVDALAAQLRAAEAQVGAAQAQVRLAQEQVNMTNVYAGVSGVVEQVNVRVGEFFTGVTPDGRSAQIMIVNNSKGLKAQVDVPDTYTAKVKKGDKVLVEIKETGKPAFESTVYVVGAAINPTTRSFNVEAKLPQDALIKANQTLVMRILDYEAKAAVAVPVNIVQSDEKSKYVYVMEKTGDKWVARKKTVITGETYEGLMEIRSGLAGGEVIITEGYQTVYDGQTVTTGK